MCLFLKEKLNATQTSNKHTDRAHDDCITHEKFIKHFPCVRYLENKGEKNVFTQNLHVGESSGRIPGKWAIAVQWVIVIAEVYAAGDTPSRTNSAHGSQDREGSIQTENKSSLPRRYRCVSEKVCYVEATCRGIERQRE